MKPFIKRLCLLSMILFSCSLRQSIAQWLSTGGPQNGDTFPILYVSEDEAFVTLYRYGLLKSTDNGATWKPYGTTVSEPRLYPFVFTKNRTVPDLYYCAYATRFGEPQIARLYRRSAPSEQWIDLMLNVPVLALEAWDSIVVAASDSAVNVSTNYGNSWRSTILGSRCYGMKADSNRGLWFLGADSLYFSSDLCETVISRPLPVKFTLPYFELFNTTRESHLFVGSYSFSGPLLYSSDSGKTWVDFSNRIPEGEAQFGYFIHPSFPFIQFLATSNGLYRRTAGDTIYTPFFKHYMVGSGEQTHKNFSLGFRRNDSLSSICVWEGTGIFRTTDEGGAWTYTSAPSGTIVNVESKRGGDEFWALTGYYGYPGTYGFVAGYALYSFRDNSWKQTQFSYWDLNSTLHDLDASPDDGTTLILCGMANYGFEYRSIDGGLTWNTLNLGAGLRFLTSVVFDPVSASRIYAFVDYNRLFVSDDKGTTWTAKWNLPMEIQSYNHHPKLSNRLSVVLDDGKILHTYNGGSTWEHRGTIPDTIKGDLPFKFWLHPADSDRFFIARDSLLISTDGGSTWSRAPLNGNVVDIVFDIDDSTIFVATSTSGVWKSTDNFVTVEALSGMQYPHIASMILHESATRRKLVVGTDGAGVWEYDLGPINSIGRNLSHITRYVLEPNYPNPFNPSTTIRFDLPYRSAVQIAIYNVLGQKVDELLSATLDAGSHQIPWTATGSAGVYICRMEAVAADNPSKRFNAVRKMLLVK